MNYTEVNQIPGLLMLIDFEKAFDSISWHLFSKHLTCSISIKDKQWYKVMHNTKRNNLKCRQDDPMSQYLFLSCAEVLGILIKNNKYITGIIVGDVEFKLSQYADDTFLNFQMILQCQ